MSNKNFFAGLEEIVARLIALFFTLLGYVIYMLSSGITDSNLSVLDWKEMVIFLLVFWFCYELLGYFLFLILNFFSNRKPEQKPDFNYNFKEEEQNQEASLELREEESSQPEPKEEG